MTMHVMPFISSLNGDVVMEELPSLTQENWKDTVWN